MPVTVLRADMKNGPDSPELNRRHLPRLEERNERVERPAKYRKSIIMQNVCNDANYESLTNIYLTLFNIIEHYTPHVMAGNQQSKLIAYWPRTIYSVDMRLVDQMATGMSGLGFKVDILVTLTLDRLISKEIGATLLTNLPTMTEVIIWLPSYICEISINMAYEQKDI